MIATMAQFVGGQRLDGTHESEPPARPAPQISAENDGFPLELWDGL